MAPSELGIQNGRNSPRTTRSHSISSDRTSLTGYGGLLSPPVSISPEPAFIAASAASQIVTNDHDSRSDTWFDQHGIEPSGETALVAPPALQLVNRFLDQLLFNFLSVSKSISLGSLRPAVSEVLKPKLAKDAISGADQELHEYLGGGEDEELLAFHKVQEPGGDWDLELVWKRTRLRCMVYSSLGDMEEEDEDFYTERGHLDGPDSNHRFSNSSGVVSPAVAIFLTSILEFMGEQVLVVAGQAAYHRLRVKHEKDENDGVSTHGDIAERVVVEESDMERVALNSTLGRLWRGWKKRIRSTNASMSMTRSFSRESLVSHLQASRAASIVPEDHTEDDARRPYLSAVLAEHEYAAGVPLPLPADDVREIEIPGLVRQSDDEEDDMESKVEEIRPLARPKSLVIIRNTFQDPLTPTSSQPRTPILLAPNSRKRSNSLPSPAPSPYKSPISKRSRPSVDIFGLPHNFTSKVDADKAEGETVDEPEAQVEERDEDVVDEESKNSSEGHKGLVSGAISGVVAIGTAAVTGPVAAANGETNALVTKEETDGDEELIEEPQIMTSSRVSIGGRVSPDNATGLSRRSSARSHSVHSLRLIDVASPKSPARSRVGSVDASDYVTGRPSGLSRSNSVQYPLSDSQTPRVTTPVSRIANTSPILRNGSSLSSRAVRNNAGRSISEKKEINVNGSTPITAVPSDLAAAAMRGVDVDTTAVSPQEPSERTPTDVTPQPAPFILSAPPAARNNRAPASLTSSGEVTQTVTAPALSSRSLAVEREGSGVPPLTPLREMMEGAPDTSDEASSIAPSNRSMSERNGHSPSASGSTLSYSQRPTDQRSTRPAVNRSSPPRVSKDEATRKGTQDSWSKPHRPTHTSGSGSSSASHKLKPVRTSEESAPNGVDDKSQSFEQLIRSDQTIQYTLTPQNMRNIEEPGSPRSPRLITPAGVSNGPDPRRPGTSRSHSSPVSKPVIVSSDASAEIPKSAKTAAKAIKPVSRPMSNTGAKLRPNAPQARDARVDRDSMGDFAEFIRSTGPANSNDPAPPRPFQMHRGANGTMRNASGSSPRVGAAANLPRRAESSAGRSRLQARDAVVPRGDSISDLIDFVRSGPQLDKDTHRIPRTVAPFRTTMDSDQMSGAVGGKAIDASLPVDVRYSQASTSVHSSVNSQSALLNNSTKNKPQPNQNRGDFGEEDMMPKRKTRRVRDPYAIDLSDEEDEYEAASRPNVIQEESLADFLRNVPPPPEAAATSVFETVPKASNKNVKKKSSTPSFRSRFVRTNSTPQLPPKPKSNGHDFRSQAARTGAPQLPSHTPIAAKFSTTPASYEPARGGNYVSQLDSARNKVAQKSYQPREAVYSGARTNDLADFLLRSEPPSSLQTQPQTFTPTLQKEEAGAFQRMFGRKKVH